MLVMCLYLGKMWALFTMQRGSVCFPHANTPPIAGALACQEGWKPAIVAEREGMYIFITGSIDPEYLHKLDLTICHHIALVSLLGIFPHSLQVFLQLIFVKIYSKIAMFWRGIKPIQGCGLLMLPLLNTSSSKVPDWLKGIFKRDGTRRLNQDVWCVSSLLSLATAVAHF